MQNAGTQLFSILRERGGQHKDGRRGKGGGTHLGVPPRKRSRCVTSRSSISVMMCERGATSARARRTAFRKPFVSNVRRDALLALHRLVLLRVADSSGASVKQLSSWSIYGETITADFIGTFSLELVVECVWDALDIFADAPIRTRETKRKEHGYVIVTSALSMVRKEIDVLHTALCTYRKFTVGCDFIPAEICHAPPILSRVKRIQF